MPPKDLSRVDFIASRIERYGLATIILIALVWWAKPHADSLIEDHKKFLDSTSQTQAKQAEILSGNSGSLNRIEIKTDRSAELIRDIHGHLIQRPNGEGSAKESTVGAN